MLADRMLSLGDSETVDFGASGRRGAECKKRARTKSKGLPGCRAAEAETTTTTHPSP